MAKSESNGQITRQITIELNVPGAYFYASDDDVAKMLIAFHWLSNDGKSRVLELLDTISASEASRVVR